MTTNFGIVRLIDANLNRLKEGIRVVEDIARYHDNNLHIASNLKTLRHLSRLGHLQELLESRDIDNDVLKKSTKSEQQRDDLASLIIANYKRAEESARTLEEILKLTDVQESQKFKDIRYNLYEIEKEHLLIHLNKDLASTITASNSK